VPRTISVLGPNGSLLYLPEDTTLHQLGTGREGDSVETQGDLPAPHKMRPPQKKNVFLGTGRHFVRNWATCWLDARIFSPWDGRSPVSHPTCDVPFPPRRSGEYRKGMIPARPLYHGGQEIGLGSRPLERASLQKTVFTTPLTRNTPSLREAMVASCTCTLRWNQVYGFRGLWEVSLSTRVALGRGGSKKTSPAGR